MLPLLENLTPKQFERRRYEVNYIFPEAELRMKPWPKDIIAAGHRHSIVLKADGTVMAVGNNKLGQCNVRDWRNIIAVAAGNVHRATNTGNAHTIGLKSDGTVVAVGDNEYGQCNLEETSN